MRSRWRVTHCRATNSSSCIALDPMKLQVPVRREKLRDLGFKDVTVLEGGFEAWRRAGYPTGNT